MNPVRDTDIIEKAREYLTRDWAITKSGRPASRVSPELVFDHSARILETARFLLKDSALTGLRIDEIILAAAAMFHDAGWVDLVRHAELEAGQIYSKPADTELLARSGRVAGEILIKLLPLRMVEKTVEIIADLKNPNPSQPEVKLIADAENLEDFGLLGIVSQIRIAQALGKSNQQVLDIWHRQQEYHYWEARIKTAFHLDLTKKIAAHRLEKMAGIYDLIELEMTLDDVQDLVPPIPSQSPTANSTVSIQKK
ncbi:MAG: hypothetical protein GX629_01845 [Phycisphaerae bacterium]|nr:hypothetical protein [Phycisphaerae bacterium]